MILLQICETRRLYMREYEDNDLEAMVPVFSDPDHMKYYPAPFTREQTQKWITRNQHRYQRDGYGLWVVCLKEGDRVIGDCGLINQTVSGKVQVEIGYHIHPQYGGRGYATEAAIACRQYAFEVLKLDKVVSIIAPGNQASIRVAEKTGLQFEHEEYIFNKRHLIYAGYTPTVNS